MRPSACLLLCSMAGLALVASGCDGTAPGDGGPGVDSGPGAEGGVFLDGGGSDGGGTDGGGGGTDAGPATCGDRRITAPEECDDGNTASGDGCDAACVIEVSPTCGNGALERAAGEECDDGNTTNGDGCDARCIVEAPSGCGDGALDLATGEECDDGNTAPGDGCAPSCQLEAVGAFCGDGTTDAGEACDDGNTTNGDGCNPTCNLRGEVSTLHSGLGSNATLAVDATYLYVGSEGSPGQLRRIEIATCTPGPCTVEPIADLPGGAAAGIATDGRGMVWVATADTTGPAVYAYDTTGSLPVVGARLTGGASTACSSAICYADGAPGIATFGGIRGLTWYSGSLWIVDPPAATILRMDPTTGDVTHVAGAPFPPGAPPTAVDGIGTAAVLVSPRYIVSDNSGVLYISDTNGASIRTLHAPTGRVGTLAGDGTMAYVDGLGGPAGPARIHRPRGITSDGTSVYWAEFNAHTVRQGHPATLDVSTLAGLVHTCPGACPAGTTCRTGICLPPAGGPVGGGFVDGTGTSAEFSAPFGIAFHFPSNSLFVTDSQNDVIRRIR